MNEGEIDGAIAANESKYVQLNANMGYHNWSTTDANSIFYEPIPDIRQPLYMILIYSLAYGIVFLFSLIGNILVIAVVCKTRRLHSLTNFFIVNLAVADLLITVFCIPINLLDSLFNGWRYGAVLCKITPYFQGVSVCASVYTLAAIAADRFLAICFALEHKMTWRIAKVIVTLIWTLALTMMMPWLLYYKQKPDIIRGQTFQFCIQEWPYDHGRELFILIVFIVCYVFPLVLIIICYFMITIRVWTRNAPGIFRYSNVIRKSKVKVIKMLALIVFWFGLSWLPLYTLFLLLSFNPPDQKSIADVLINICVPIAQWLAMSNSGVNPLIYCFFSKAIRKSVVAMLSCSATLNHHYTRQNSRTGSRLVSLDVYTNGQVSIRMHNKKKTEKSFFSCNGNTCESMFYN